MGGASTSCDLVYHVSVSSMGFESVMRTPLDCNRFKAAACRFERWDVDSTATGGGRPAAAQASMSSGRNSNFFPKPLTDLGKLPIPARVSACLRRSVDSLQFRMSIRSRRVSNFFIVVTPCVSIPEPKGAAL